MTHWPKLDYSAGKETIDTLHLWLQIVGKIRLLHSPYLNHAWNATFYMNARGLTTGLIPGAGMPFEIQFDFIDHQMLIHLANGQMKSIPLQPMTVKAFYEKLMSDLKDLGIEASICTKPNEVMDPIPFEKDELHQSYDSSVAHDLWLAFLNAHRVMMEFRSKFYGKNSPVHLFWGSFDLAVTRFSGNSAPEHPAGIPHLPDKIAKEAYCQEVMSVGFWPGAGLGYAAFYAYAYPSPEAFKSRKVLPEEAFYSQDFGEFVLPYDAVAQAEDPDAFLMSFFESTYTHAAELLKWDFEASMETCKRVM